MVDWAGSCGKKISSTQMSIEELLEALKIDIVKEGEAGFASKEMGEFEKELRARGAKRHQLGKYKSACRDIGRLKNKKVRCSPAWELPVNPDLQQAIRRVRDIGANILVKLRKETK